MVIGIPASILAFLRDPVPWGKAGLLSDNQFRAAFCATQSETHVCCVLFLPLSHTLRYQSRTIFSGVVNSSRPCLPAETFSTYFDEKLTSSLVTLGNSEQSVQNKTRSKKTKPASCVCATFCAVRNSFGSKIAALIKKKTQQRALASTFWLARCDCLCLCSVRVIIFNYNLRFVLFGIANLNT